MSVRYLTFIEKEKLFEITVGFCEHDIQKISSLEIDIGLMLPIINPILKPRPSDHKTAAHYSEVAKLHGACNASEAHGEHAHQAGKSAARNKNRVPLKDGQRQHEIISLASKKMSIHNK